MCGRGDRHPPQIYSDKRAHFQADCRDIKSACSCHAARRLSLIIYGNAVWDLLLNLAWQDQRYMSKTAMPVLRPGRPWDYRRPVAQIPLLMLALPSPMVQFPSLFFPEQPSIFRSCAHGLPLFRAAPPTAPLLHGESPAPQLRGTAPVSQLFVPTLSAYRVPTWLEKLSGSDASCPAKRAPHSRRLHGRDAII